MASNSIREYLDIPAEKRDFNAGLEIYNTLGRNPNLKRLFQIKGPSEYNVAKLENELKEILKREGDKTFEISTPKIKKKEENPEAKAPKGKEAPKSLTDLTEERKKLLQESAHLHSRLDVTVNKETLRASCETIVYNAMRINQIWKILDHFEQTGEILEEATITKPDPKKSKDYSSMDSGQLIKERNNLRSNITKNKNNPDKLAVLNAQLQIVEDLLKPKN